MLAAENLLESLLDIEETCSSKYENDDHDFGETLKIYEGTSCNHEVRYSDGKKRTVPFD